MIKMAFVGSILAFMAAIFFSVLLSVILARLIEAQKRKEQEEIDKIQEEANPVIREMKMQAYWLRRNAKASECNAIANWSSVINDMTNLRRP